MASDQAFMERMRRRAAQSAADIAIERAAAGEATTTAPGTALDAMGRVLAVGDALFLNTRQLPLVRVMGVNPVLDPSLPPGLVQVHVIYAETFVLPAGKATAEFMRVATAAEAPPMPVVLQEATATPSAPAEETH